MQDSGQARVAALLESRVTTAEAALSWLGDVWQYFLDSGLYFSGGPADEHSARRLQLLDRINAVAFQFDSPNTKAEAARIVAHVLNASERYDEAVSYYERAVAQLEAVGEDAVAARTRLGYASALKMVGAHVRALTVCAEADAWFVAHGDDNAHARALVNTGNVYHHVDEHAKALECHQEAARIFEGQEDSNALAGVYLNLANSLAFLDRFEESDEMYRRAEDIATQCGLGSLADQSRYNRAYLLFLRGRYSDAIGTFDELRKRFAANGSDRHAALCDLDTSEVYLQLNLPTEAAKLATRARDSFRRLGMQYERAKAVAFIGVAAMAQGRFEEALEQFEAAETMFVKEDNEFWTEMSRLYRAEVMATIGRYAEARSLATDALAKYRQRKMASQAGMALIVLGKVAVALGEAEALHSITAELLDLIANKQVPLLEFPGYMLCGKAAEQEGRPSDAREYYRLAAKTIEEHRSYLHHDELRVRFLEGKDAVYESLVRLDLEGGDRLSHQDAFGWCERAKARSLADLVSPHLPLVRSAADKALLDRVHRRREQLNSRYVRLRGDRGEFDVPVSAEEIERVESDLEADLEILVRSDAELGSLVGAMHSSVADVQGSLPPDTAMVEYFILQGEVMAFVIADNAFTVYQHLAPVERIVQFKQNLDFQLQKFVLGSRYVTDHAEQMLQVTILYLGRLYEDLVSPWVDDVEASNLVIVPHGELHALPFHALFDGRRYLIDRFAISYAPSAEVFRRTGNGPCASGKGLIVGHADELAPAIDDEIQQLYKLMPESRICHGSNATRQNLFEAAHDARFIHVSTHSFFRADNPMFSGFELADGAVTALDLYSLSWPSELVTLTGCSTGVAQVRAGDELMGLVRGILHTGARSLLMSLWNVSDEATVVLVDAFYREWLACSSKVVSIRRAMQRVREQYPHPFHWAPFVLIGRP